MKKRLGILLLGVICLLGVIWFFAGSDLFRDANPSLSRSPEFLRTESLSREQGKPAMKFRSKERTQERSHRPEQLVSFILPEVQIDGLGLEEALEKLQEAYVDVCAKSGEKALPFRFEVPDDGGLRLRMKLSSRNFSGSVRLLAAAAGMSVTRKELTYVFKKLRDDGGELRRTIHSPTDLKSQLGVMAGIKAQDANGMDFRELLARIGVTLEPETQVTMAANGLTIMGTESADVAKLQALIGQLDVEKVVQLKVTSKLLELPAGTEWEGKKLERLSDSEVQLFMRAMAQRGVDLITMPSIMTRGLADEAEIEMVNDVTIPSAAGGSESQMVGKVMKVRAGAYGFGQTVDATFTDTIFDEKGLRGGGIQELTHLKAEGFGSDGETRISIQERADGSRALILVTGELIDATGVPIRPTGGK